MRVILFGGSGMVGQGVLRECWLDPGVVQVLSVGRRPVGPNHPKLVSLVLPDLTQLGPIEDQLRGYDACFYCLGISALGRTEAQYRSVTYDLTLAAGRTLARLNPRMTFVYVSGAGTDRSGQGPRMWARVKGQTENALLQLPFQGVYLFRPGAIQPLHGLRSKTPLYRVIYVLLRPFLPLFLWLAPSSVTTTEKVGRAMIRVVREGAPDPRVETREINRLGR
jgi:uncharacterized protein YbjT (DUF2867 family)